MASLLAATTLAATPAVAAPTGPTGPTPQVSDEAIFVICEVKPSVYNRWVKRGRRAHRKLDAIRGTNHASKRWVKTLDCVTVKRHDAIKHRVRSIEHKLKKCRSGTACYWRWQFRKLPPAGRAWAINTSACEVRAVWPNKRAAARFDNGNGFLGAFQWVLSTWHSAGGSGSPTTATWYEQAVRAWFWHLSHPRGQWPVCGE